MAKYRIRKYNKAFANMLGGEASGDAFQTDFLTDAIHVSLHTNSYVPNRATHEVFSDVTSEITGTGYTAGGQALASKTIVVTAADSWGTARANSTAYAVGDVYRPAAANGHLYRVIVAGTSAASPPTFPTVDGQTVADGTATIAEIGSAITVIDSADPSWTTATFSLVRYGVVRRNTGTASTSPLLYLVEFLNEDGVTPEDQGVSGSTFSIVLSALGWQNYAHP